MQSNILLRTKYLTKLITLLLLLYSTFELLAKELKWQSKTKRIEEKNEEQQEELDQEELNFQRELDQELTKLHTEATPDIRDFHDILNDLLVEFSYDIRSGKIKNAKNISIRKIDLSKGIPKNYQTYLKLLITEKIKESTKIRVINCLPCSTRTSRIINERIVITSPATNINELKRAAELLGIDLFMDIIMVYHKTHMVLAVQVFKTETQELVWARTYNSEKIRSRFQKLAIDYSQVEKARKSDEYIPEYRLLLGFGGGGLPNVAGDTYDSSMIIFKIRSTERFDNRKSEFGLSSSVYMSIKSVLSEYPKLAGTGIEEEEIEEESATATAKPKPFSYAISIFGLYTHNFLGLVESYDQVRQGLHLGLGGIVSSGYLAPAVKVGWDIYLGRRFGFNISTLYILPSQIVMGSQVMTTRGGLGAELVLSLNY